MNIEISGRNYEISDRIRELITTKLQRVTKLFQDIIEIRCVLNVEKYRNICEIMIIGKTYDTKSMQEADTMEEAILSTIDHLKRQATKERKKVREHRGKGNSRRLTPDSWTVQVMEPSLLDRSTSPNQPRIIKTSNLPIRPMSVEQAAMTLDDSKNEFIVFRDLDTDKVTVIYRRRDENFGMIAPEF